jgi:hypothetical protein
MSRHAWAEYVESPEVRNLLWMSKERLKLAWESDRKDPKAYPLNTSYVLATIQEGVTARSRKRSTKLRFTLNPRRLAELVREKLVKSIWEENHAGKFEDAIAQATPRNSKEFNNSWRVFQGIIRAMEAAYLVDYWCQEFMPRPKVNILHKGLDQTAKAAGIGHQIQKGFAEFLDDLCPCGLKRHREAVRKLSSRSKRMRRQK